MTTNNSNMGVPKNCKQLDPAKKVRIKIDTKGNVLYVNNYFTAVTKLKITDVILKDLGSLFDSDMPKMASNFILDELKNDNSYIIFKGRVKGNECYWGFAKSITEYNNFNEVKGYLLEVKMLPSKAISKMERLYDILKEIENNAGLSAAEKYFYGYVEDKGMRMEDFILNIAEVNQKQAEKYFEIDEDAPVKKKKRSWF